MPLLNRQAEWLPPFFHNCLSPPLLLPENLRHSVTSSISRGVLRCAMLGLGAAG